MNRMAILALALVAGSAVGSDEIDKFTFCKSAGADTAEIIMEARQVGLPLADVLEIYGESESESMRNLGRSLAMDAYSRPAYSTPEFQQKAISDFRDEIHLQCLQSF